MPQGTNASTEQMQVFSTQVADAAGRLDAMLKGLVNQLEPLQTGWVGMGGTSFNQTLEVVQVETTKMNSALNKLAADVGTAGVKYTGADDEQKSAIDDVKGMATGITSSLRAL